MAADQVNPWDVVEDIGEAAADFGGAIPIVGGIVQAAGKAADKVAEMAKKAAHAKRKAKKGHRKAKKHARKVKHAKANAHKQGQGMPKPESTDGQEATLAASVEPVTSPGPKPALLIGGAALLGVLAIAFGKK